MGDNLSRADRAVFESLLHMEDPEQDFLASNGPVLRSRRRASSGEDKSNILSFASKLRMTSRTSPTSAVEATT